MFDDVLDERKLHVGGIGDHDALGALAGVQYDGGIVEHRERERPLVADNLDAVFARRFMGYETPRTAAWLCSQGHRRP